MTEGSLLPQSHSHIKLNTFNMVNHVAIDVFTSLILFFLFTLTASIRQEFISIRIASSSKVLENNILRLLEGGKTTGQYGYMDRMESILSLLNLRSSPHLLT